MYLSFSIHLVCYIIKEVKIERVTVFQNYDRDKFKLIFLHFWRVSMVNHFGVVIERILWVFVFDDVLAHYLCFPFC